MSRLEVHKFGGTSVADSSHMRAVARLILKARKETDIIIVSSATAGPRPHRDHRREDRRASPRSGSETGRRGGRGL
ncbi:MAG: hypothetical protein GY854_24855 [Deltaproteobacteria bacterium]|nr:hypothetical protein [Deltaproteobacteria bacterium]